MKKKKAAAKAKAKAGSKADKLERGIKPKKAKAKKPTSLTAGEAITVASEIATAIVEGVKLATAAIAKAVTDRAEADKALAAAMPETSELAHNQSCVHVLGQATGALGNLGFVKFLYERGISDAEIIDVRDRLVKLARAFYVDPEAERE